ncbi:hypothetical protein GMA3_94 [Gordonia phage GMA3]|uniref:Uncharacterized protein n=1 Tax=Gordonia phage GMA3 TaxID=1647284 RepID=A0A0K0NKN4_9CAUD|nr:hypothetical protein AU105_gp094 [Gordonia phage GMA3]AKL88271.1 hypothetical protein GMA3_94 [Gordonia phage GMA3]
MLWIVPIDADIDDYAREWVDYFAGDVYGAIVDSDDYAISDNSVWGVYGDDYAMQTLSEYVRYALEEISQTIKDNKRKAMCA